MKKITWAIVVAGLLLVCPALPANAGGAPGGGYHGGGGSGGYHGGGYSGGGYHGGGPYWSGGVGIYIGGPGWWGWPGWWGPSYPYYAAPPVVIQQTPPVYVQQDPAPPQQPYWYYCQSAGAYYPYVKECPGGWMTVVPQPAPPGR